MTLQDSVEIVMNTRQARTAHREQRIPFHDTDLAVFERDGHRVRVEVRDGEPWFVLPDLCKALGLSNPAMVASRLNPEGISQTYTLTAGGKQQVTIVDESAMYEAVLRSNKSEAIKFSRWITKDILPQIRKTGMYLPQTTSDPFELMQEMLNRLRATDRTANEAKDLAVRTEARVDAIEGRHGWYAALGFAIYHDLDTSKPYLQRLGKKATACAKVRGLTPHKVPHEHYGAVNSYPEDIWEEAVALLEEEESAALFGLPVKP